MIIIWLLIKSPLSGHDYPSRIQVLLSRNFRVLHVYLSRGPWWATMPMMKIHSSPPDDHRSLFDTFVNMQLASLNPFVADQVIFCKLYWATPTLGRQVLRQVVKISPQAPATVVGCGKASPF